jgi:hypothetical protein
MNNFLKLPINFRIYADRKSELDLKYNHELCQIQDDYLNQHPHLKPEVRWLYGNYPMNKDIYVKKWFGKEVFIIYLYNNIYSRTYFLF